MPTRESEPKIRFPDDPLNFEDGVAATKKELLDSIPDNVRRILHKKRRSPQERVEIIQFLHVCLKDAPYKSSEEILAFFSRDFLTQFRSELLLISKERTVRFQLRAMAERVLSEDSFMKRYINSDGKPEDIISGTIASPIFTWYIETAFMSLEKTIRRISNYAPQPEIAIKNLIRLGTLYGKFNSLTDTREPNAARVYYRYLLSPLKCSPPYH